MFACVRRSEERGWDRSYLAAGRALCYGPVLVNKILTAYEGLGRVTGPSARKIVCQLVMIIHHVLILGYITSLTYIFVRVKTEAEQLHSVA